MKDHIVVIGGSGFIGQGFIACLKDMNIPYNSLSRSSKSQNTVYWDGKNSGEWISVLEDARAIINLTGRSINCRLTNKNKQEILQSRLNPIHALYQGVQSCNNPPKIWIQASSVGIYPNVQDEPCDENSSSGNDFLSKVCQQWENIFLNLNLPEIRKVILRIGWVLGKEGGVLIPLVNLVRKGLGGHVGSGLQMISWIHQHDLNHIMIQAIKSKKYNGIFNAVSNCPVSNKKFMNALRQQFNIKIGPPIPKPAVYLGAFLMGTSASLALSSKYCVPKNLNDLGFQFEYETLENSFHSLFK